MKAPGRNDYRIVISRSQHRLRADIYLFGVRDLMPAFPIPLRPGETEPILSLNPILHELYDQDGYDLIIDYRQPLAASTVRSRCSVGQAACHPVG
jgi:hypothetical protein